MTEQWDAQTDLLIAGSGAGGMTAAITAKAMGLDALLVEKGSQYGGSTALSGGALWVPNSPELRRLGLSDTPDSVKEYLTAVVGEEVSETRVSAYLENGPHAMELLENVGPHMRFEWAPGYSDYHPELPGGRPRGRSLEAQAFDARLLGEDEELMLSDGLPIPFGIWMNSAEFRQLVQMGRTQDSLKTMGVMAWRVASNLIRKRHMKTLGQSLIGRMRLTMKDLKIPLWLNSPIVELLTEGDRVIGAVLEQGERSGKYLRIRADYGVLLATGGFDHNIEMRQQYLMDGGRSDFSAGAKTNLGDGIRLGASLGADLALMDDAWWMPSFEFPDGSLFVLVAERAIPRAIIVDQSGRRFTNEASPYVNFVHDQLRGRHDPAWFIMDAKAKNRFQFAALIPGMPIPEPWYEAGVAHTAPSIGELATSIGIPAGQLAKTIARFNKFVRKGRDDDFDRGASAYDRYYGDQTLSNPALDYLHKGPFHAFKIVIGDLGTKGGLVTDENSRVLRADGTSIHGLYAVGNTSASVMGRDYAGAGATIGPAVVFGYIGALDAAKRRRDQAR